MVLSEEENVEATFLKLLESKWKRALREYRLKVGGYDAKYLNKAKLLSLDLSLP
jgi:hypothetical protein